MRMRCVPCRAEPCRAPAPQGGRRAGARGGGSSRAVPAPLRSAPGGAHGAHAAGLRDPPLPPHSAEPPGQRRGRAGSGGLGSGSRDGGGPSSPVRSAARAAPQPLRSPDGRGAGWALSEPPRPALPCPAAAPARPRGPRPPPLWLPPSLPGPPSPPAVPPPPRSRTPRAVRCGEPGSAAAPALFLAGPM